MTRSDPTSVRDRTADRAVGAATRNSEDLAMRHTGSLIVVVLAWSAFAPEAWAAPAPADSVAWAARLAAGVAQLRSTIGLWNVTTEFLDDSGKVARATRGTYRFDWVIPDRVVSGRSDLPEMNQAAGILFYVRETKEEIEMVSVSSDGRLWVMTGPVDGEVRTTPDVATVGGGTMRLRFTRAAVRPDGFESRMEYSLDQGKTWAPGNHQVFTRAASEG